MNSFLRLYGVHFLILGLGAWPGLLQAGAPGVEEKPYRQYPELPDVLYFDGFETNATAWKQGEREVVPGTNNHCYRLGAVKHDKDEIYVANVDLPVKLPGAEANDIHIQFNFFAEHSGELSIRLKEGDFEAKPRSVKIGAWSTLLLRVADFHKEKTRMTKDNAFTGVEMSFSKAAVKPCIVRIDDFIITRGVQPAMLVSSAAALEVKRVALIKTLAQDGFTFSPQIKDTLQGVLKRQPATRRGKTVLVVGARPGDTEELAKDLTASAKLKAAGFNFVAATGPDGSPLGGLDDMRTLLSYSARKNEAEMALLMLGYADSEGAGRPSEGVRAVLERTLEANCVPIACLPPGEEGNEKGKLNIFISSLTNACVELRLPCIDEGFGMKDVKNAFNGRDLAPPGMEKFAELAVLAIKHMEAMARR